MLNNICLVGNPNCGKTTLFNLLTGKNEKVGNRTGVTIEKKSANYKKNAKITVSDLPGTYSLYSGSIDEQMVYGTLKNFNGVIINIVDGTNLLRNFRLTSELILLKKPMIIAINMVDEMEKKGITVDEKRLSNILGIPVICFSARKKRNIEKVINSAINLSNIPKSMFYDELYKFSESCITVNSANVKPTVTDKIDNVISNKYLGLPIFALILFLIYYITYSVGGILGEFITDKINALGNAFAVRLNNGGAGWLGSLINGAILKGVGAVLSFLPQICILFLFLAILEETGYSARAAFLCEGITDVIGLSGKSLITFGVSCGCTVGGILSARSIEDEKKRTLTIFLSPFMPCGAKSLVFSWLIGKIFGGNPLISASLYVLSIFSVAVFGKLLSKTKKFLSKSGTIIEIPPLRLPTVRGIAGTIKEKAEDFVLKAGSIVFIVSVCVWFLQSFGLNGYTENVKDSFLFYIGDKLKYIFIPLGFGNWQSAVAVISGIFAKEAIIQTLTVVVNDQSVLFSSGFSAYSFLVFIMLMPPCVAALSAARKELKSKKEFYFMIVFQALVAYFMAFLINGIGYLIENRIFAAIPLTLIVFGVIISIKIIKNKCGCKDCRACKEKLCKIREKANTTI